MAIKTQIIKIDPQVIESGLIDIIIDVLRRGGIAAYPTDTFYGLGVNCYREKAVEKVYRLKKREYDKPISLVVSDVAMVRGVCMNIPPAFEEMAKSFWPGPLTLILKASSSRLPSVLLGEDGSIGIRLPDFPWLRELIRRAGFPLTATSANISGEKEIFQPDKVIEIFEGKVDLIVDGGMTPGQLPSTVVDLTSEKPKIIREGALPSTRLSPYL
jgi:L-threonylcarbamoyladenylate synthase